MRYLSVLLCAVMGLACAPAADAWERAGALDYPATAHCPSENMCLLVGCPAPGKPSFEMMVYEHGKAPGEPFYIAVDGQRFELHSGTSYSCRLTTSIPGPPCTPSALPSGTTRP